MQAGFAVTSTVITSLRGTAPARHTDERAWRRNRLFALVAVGLAAVAGLVLWAQLRADDDAAVPPIAIPPIADLNWEVVDDAEIVEVAENLISVRYVPLGPNGADSDGNEFGTIRAELPSSVLAGVVAEGYELRVRCTHEPTAVSVRVCRSGLYTDAGSPPPWGSYFAGPSPERGPEVCRSVPRADEVEITVYAYPAAPSATYSEFELRPTTESAGCQ